LWQPYAKPHGKTYRYPYVHGYANPGYDGHSYCYFDSHGDPNSNPEVNANTQI
jgi:hypothetical protein